MGENTLHREKQSLYSEIGQNFSLSMQSTFLHAEYLSLLSVQGQVRVIWCISNFDDLASTFHLNFQQSLYC